MTNIANTLSHLPKTTSALFGVVMAFVLTASTIAAPAVRIESTIGVANVTAGDTSYIDSVSAGYDETVKVQLWYHNMEEADSGLVADDLNVAFNVPTAQGSNQTITGTVSGANTNTVVSTANVNLGRDDAYLEYIPGTAKWRHNAGTNDSLNYKTETVSDNIVTSGAGLVLEDAEPCFNFEATVTILLRVRVPSISIEKSVATPGSGQAWANEINVEAGDKVKFLFTAVNDGNSQLNNVTIGDVLPDGLKYVKGSTIVTNGNHPDGVAISVDDIVNGGLNLNAFAVGGYSYVTIEAQVANAADLDCGLNRLVNKAVAKSDKAVIRTDTAIVNVNVECEQETTPQFDCVVLATALSNANRTVDATVTTTQSGGATLNSVSINFGDGTDVNQAKATHSYDTEGTYNIVGTATFNVDDVVKSVTCTDTVSFQDNVEVCEIPGKGHLAKDDLNCKEDTPTTPVTPTVLPNTGAGSLIVTILGASSAAAGAYGFIQNRRLV